jgi:TPR repeat protein
MTMAFTATARSASGEAPVHARNGLAHECSDKDVATDLAREFLALGMMHMTGQSVPPDLVAAHKWFNLAAMHGDPVAVRLRREIAAEMSPGEIAAAQRAARDWRAAQ